MLKAIWAARWYLLLGFLVFTIVLAVTVPLHFVWRYVEPHLGNLPVQIQRVSGTVWNGQLQVNVPATGPLDIDWQLQPLPLLAAEADLKLRLIGDGIEVDTRAIVDKSQQLQIIDADGQLSTKHLRHVLAQGQASLQGDFELADLNTRIDITNQQILELDGRLIFSGGDVGFPVDGNPVQATLPLLVGQLSKEQEKSVLNINTQEGQAIGQAFMQNDGWGGVAIRRRFLDILGQQWPAEATADTVIFEVSQKVM